MALCTSYSCLNLKFGRHFILVLLRSIAVIRKQLPLDTSILGLICHMEFMHSARKILSLRSRQDILSFVHIPLSFPTAFRRLRRALPRHRSPSDNKPHWTLVPRRNGQSGWCWLPQSSCEAGTLFDVSSQDSREMKPYGNREKNMRPCIGPINYQAAHALRKHRCSKSGYYNTRS